MNACKGCSVALVTGWAWKQMDHAERAASESSEHAGKGLCRRCWIRDRRQTGPLLEARLQRLDWLVDEWAFLADPSLSQRANAESLAPRFGLKVKTLERYLALLRSQGRLAALPPRVGLDGRLHDRQEVAA